VSAHDPALSAANEYVRFITSTIGAAEGAQQKKLAKGKVATYDPKSDKKLNIYVAKSWPAWQTKYIEVVREQLEKLGLAFDLKHARDKIDKADMKKAMPFVQTLKRRLDNGESQEAVLERKLAFDEVTVLKEMIPGLKSTVPKLKDVQIVLVEEGGKAGTKIDGQKVEGLGQQAAFAEPGQPSFEFTNV
jgi:leucyl-tRNA synthetase